MNGTITITFGDVCENHVKMQKLGILADSGFSVGDLKTAKEKFELKGCICEYIDLNFENKFCEAGVLIIRNGILAFIEKDNKEIYDILSKLEWDKKALMYGRVVNKKARYNLCFADISQEPNYEKGEGRVIPFDKCSILENIRLKIPEFLGEKGKNLLAEGNYYYDKKCMIGFHGDSERRKVIAFRFGEPMKLYYRWHKGSTILSKEVEININGGDVYIMSEKAVGFDWKKINISTLRHGAGNINKESVNTK